MCNNSCTNHMIALINQGLPQKLLYILNVLFINNFGEHSESVSFEHIIFGDLDIFSQAANNNKNFVLIDIELFY